jgi:hypothetical protein
VDSTLDRRAVRRLARVLGRRWGALRSRKSSLVMLSAAITAMRSTPAILPLPRISRICESR